MLQLICFRILGVLFFLNESPAFGAVISPAEYRADQILIQPKTGVSGKALVAFHAAHGTSVLQTFAAAGGAQVITVPAGETVPGLVAQ